MTRSKPQSCVGCACEHHGSDFSAVEGTGSNRVLVVAEASGESEQREQLPLRPHARAGSIFERCLRRMSLDRQSFSITNVLRCRPKNNWLDGAPWEFNAISQCRPNLERVIQDRRPLAILALGTIPTRELTGLSGKYLGVLHLSGYVLPYWNTTGQDGPQIPVVPCYHPAYLGRGRADHQGVFSRIVNRAVNIARGSDKSWLWGVDPKRPDTWGSLKYVLHPSLDEADAFTRYVLANPQLTIAMDIETSESVDLDEDAREGYSDTQIRLAQFSTGNGHGIAFPWEGHYRHLAMVIFNSCNSKYGHNWNLFDHKVIRTVAAREGLVYEPRGPMFDTLDMFHHWQPDLAANLQAACQFIQAPFPWKHLAGTDIEFYGCCDVDNTHQLGEMLVSTLKRDGIWGDHERGYLGMVYELRPVLSGMEDRGVPIDDAARVRLGEAFDQASVKLGVELDEMVPEQCRGVDPKNGLKTFPKELKPHFPPELYEKAQSEQDRHFPEAQARELKFADKDGATYHYEVREFDTPDLDTSGNPVLRKFRRWCRIYAFNPNSKDQVFAYMDARGHARPKNKHREDEEGNNPDTTGAKELLRLANRTGDTFYLKVIEYRGLTKMRGTYVEGFKPGADGRVHPAFTFDTAIGQTSSRNPNCFSPDTEALTLRGWVRFDRLDKKEDKLAQYDLSTGQITFDCPIYHIVQDIKGSLLHIETEKQVDLLVTPDHRCLVGDRKNGQWRFVPATDYPKDGWQLQAATYVGGLTHYSEEQIALICALQADGHVMKPGGHYDFVFTKERKIERLRMCLDVLGISYRLKRGKRARFYISRKDIPRWWQDKKTFGPWILDLTRESLDYMTEEVWFWDGSHDRRSMFSSAIESNAEWVQILTLLSGRRARLRKQKLVTKKFHWFVDASNTDRSMTTNHTSKYATYNGLVHCVSMPFGTVVVRRNGRVAITGNSHNFPKLKPTPELANAMRGMIAAPEGYEISEWDYKTCHALTLAFLAEDPDYMRLTRIDVHSAVAGHMLECWNVRDILRESDDELRARFKWLKSDPARKLIRDDQAKHAILGIGNGLKAKGLFERYMENFTMRECPECKLHGRSRKCKLCKGKGVPSGIAVAQRFLDLLQNLFPRIFQYLEGQRKQAHEQMKLVTPFLFMRRFYEVFRWDSKKSDWGHGDQSEQAVAFRHPNIAFCHIRQALKNLHEAGAAERYGLFNNVHDSFMFCYPQELRAQHIQDVYPILVRPNPVLVNSTAPRGLVIGVEASCGPRWNEMSEIGLPKLVLPETICQTA